MTNKQSFYESINTDTIFNFDFFRKVLGYSMYDKPFMGIVATKLVSIGRNDVVQAYNEWYAAWKSKDNLLMTQIGEQYMKEVDIQFEKWQKKQQVKAVSEWQQKRIALLTLKKELLLSMKS